MQPSDDMLNLVFDGSYARFWTAELGGERLAADLARIQAVCNLRPGLSVLDLGCAYGRIANRLAAEGIVVTALDQSADLLELARSAAPDPPPTFVRGDMRKLDMHACFDVVLLWFSTFGYFSEEENGAVLAGACQSLRPGGLLVIETRNWDRIHREFDPWSVRVNDNDLLVEKHEFVPSTGRQHTEQLLLINGRSYRRSYFLRRYTAAELTAMLYAAGFAEVFAQGEDGKLLTAEHHRLIVTAVRSADERA